MVDTNCCGIAKLLSTNNEGKTKGSRNKTKTQTQLKRKPKLSFSTLSFLKVDPLYKCRSVSFYREVSGLLTYQEYRRVKWIKTECAWLVLGNLQLGLHVISAP
jgi:hypothetical protein